jgi:hypothetical protein
MPRRRQVFGQEPVLLLRTGRHLPVALQAIERAWPGCEVAVVGTPGSEAVIEQAGVPVDRIFVYRAAASFQPFAFWRSGIARAARRRGYRRLAVLWNDPAGTGQGNVDRTAFLQSPSGFVAITPDGRLIDRRLNLQVRHEVRRAAASCIAAIVLGALFVPAWILGGRR